MTREETIRKALRDIGDGCRILADHVGQDGATPEVRALVKELANNLVAVKDLLMAEASEAQR